MEKLNSTLRKLYQDKGDRPRRELKEFYLEHTVYKSAVGGSRFMSILRGETVLDAVDIYVFSKFFGLSVKQLIAETLPDLDVQNLKFETNETERLETESFGFNN
jgi:hypothetical protein